MELSAEDFNSIDILARRFARKYGKTAVYGEDDLYQEAWIITMEALPKYDKERSNSLGAFMNKVIQTKLINFIRDNVCDPRESADPDRKSIRNPLTIDEKYEGTCPETSLEGAIMSELEHQIKDMNEEDAASALGLSHLLLKQCNECGARKMPVDYDDCSQSADGKMNLCRLCREMRASGRRIDRMLGFKPKRSSRIGYSGYRGVTLHKASGKWFARIGLIIDGKTKQTNIGYFNSREEAVRAYDQAAREHHGENAKLNF